MRIPSLVVLAAAALAGCGDPDLDKPSIVAAPKIAREVLHVPVGGYPLLICVACGVTLGENGNPCIFIHEGTEVRLCCDRCKETFLVEPEKYLEKIREARAKK